MRVVLAFSGGGKALLGPTTPMQGFRDLINAALNVGQGEVAKH